MSELFNAYAPWVLTAFRVENVLVQPWVRGYKWSGVTLDGLPAVSRWLDAIAKRPAVKRGVDVPEPVDLEEMIRKADEARAKVSGILV